MPDTNKQRLRVTFSKESKLKYISHLDLVLAWERALRRAELPLAYSQGFHPQAKLQMASGLPLGYTGTAEVMDVVLNESMPAQAFFSRVSPVLPEGLTVKVVEEVDLKAPSLQSMLHQAEYRVFVKTSLSAQELSKRIADMLATDRLEQERVRKQRVETFDLRPLVDDVRLESVDNEAILWMRLSAGQRGSVRPDAVLAALDVSDAHVRIERTKLLFEFDSL